MFKRKMQRSSLLNIINLCSLFVLALLAVTAVGTSKAEANSHHSANNEPRKDSYWIEQRVDHFDIFDRRTWRQRYFVNDEFYEEGGPAFLMVGGEGEIRKPKSDGNLFSKLAKERGAICFALEHRFYGESRPTSDVSSENLRYLSSKQALEDLAIFINKMKKSMNIDKWVLFGGSYPGSLVLWSRLKFPHIVDGAVAASAPLEARFNFKEYLKLVAQSLSLYGGPTCINSLQKANANITRLFELENGLEILHDVFNLCDETEMTTSDKQLLQSILHSKVEKVIQYSKDNTLFDEPTLRSLSISKFCDIMNNNNLGSEVKRLAEARRVMMNNSNQCLSYKFNEFVKRNRNVAWKMNGMRPWLYQMCTEFGWFQTTEESEQPFRGVPSSFSVHLCTSIFGPELKSEDIIPSIELTNLLYGGKDIANTISRAVLVNGGVDPWHDVSYTKSKNNVLISEAIEDITSQPASGNKSNKGWDYLNPQGFISIFLPSSSHCEVFRRDAENDSLELSNARKAIALLVEAWTSI